MYSCCLKASDDNIFGKSVGANIAIAVPPTLPRKSLDNALQQPAGLDSASLADFENSDGEDLEAGTSSALERNVYIYIYYNIYTEHIYIYIWNLSLSLSLYIYREYIKHT